MGVVSVRLARMLCAFGLASLWVACSTSSGNHAPSASLPEPEIGRFASPNPGSVNTLWLRVPGGLIVVDTGRNVSGGRRAVAELQATRRPVLAILITHPHPDHVGGMGVLHQAFPQAPIYASKATGSWMRSDPLGFYPLARLADPDFPAELTFPDHTVEPDQPLDLGGVRLETAEFGAGESQTATAYYDPATGALFVGDLTSNRATPALLEGNTCGWLINLDRLRTRFPHARTVYAGHGDPAQPAEQIDAQRTYLRHIRGLVRGAVNATSPAGQTVTPGEQQAIIAELDRAYPNYPLVASLATLKEENVKGVARELLAEDPAGLPAACHGS
jgi:glyoxylase-like metal-dependent hydrolase (beta-lactamase superfamily II)